MSSTATATATALHLINGEFTGEPANERRNPARPHEVAVLAASGTAEDVTAAISAAHAA